MTETNTPTGADDRLLTFTLPDRNARGRAVRLGPTLQQVLAAHDYPPAIRILLSEALVLTALLGSLLKSEGSQLTMQAQSDGMVELLVCDYLDGAVRGYVKHDASRIDEPGVHPDLPALFGDGTLTITFDVAETGQRYQGVVPLEGPSLTAAVESYFARSEQVPTLLRIAVGIGRDSGTAGGLLIQHLAQGEEGGERLDMRATHADWEHVEVMGRSISDAELLDRTLSLEDVVWRLFHEEREVRYEPHGRVTRGCRCTISHFEEVLARFPAEDRRDMRDEHGVILVDCAFCSRQFPIQD